MKAAMIAKDTNRLTVLRGLMSQTLNASKTNSPIVTDVQMLALLRKNMNSSATAAQEFKDAGRQDLADKEDSQIKVLEEYAGSVEVVGEQEIRDAVTKTVDSMKAEGAKVQIGDVLKRVFAPDVLGEKPVERSEVARIVKQILA